MYLCDVSRELTLLSLSVSLSARLPLPPPLCLRGGCLCQMPVLTQGWESWGQPQPFRAAGGQIQRWQGSLPGRHQKGSTHSVASLLDLVKTHSVFQKNLHSGWWWCSVLRVFCFYLFISVINNLINGIYIFFEQWLFSNCVTIPATIDSLFLFLCRPSTPPRSFPTHRASCCCVRQPKSSAGPSTTVPSLWCGGEAASSEGTCNFICTNIASLPPYHIVQLNVIRHVSHWCWKLWWWRCHRALVIDKNKNEEFLCWYKMFQKAF